MGRGGGKGLRGFRENTTPARVVSCKFRKGLKRDGSSRIEGKDRRRLPLLGEFRLFVCDHFDCIFSLVFCSVLSYQ